MIDVTSQITDNADFTWNKTKFEDILSELERLNNNPEEFSNFEIINEKTLQNIKEFFRTSDSKEITEIFQIFMDPEEFEATSKYLDKAKELSETAGINILILANSLRDTFNDEFVNSLTPEIIRAEKQIADAKGIEYQVGRVGVDIKDPAVITPEYLQELKTVCDKLKKLNINIRWTEESQPIELLKEMQRFADMCEKHNIEFSWHSDRHGKAELAYHNLRKILYLGKPEDVAKILNSIPKEIKEKHGNALTSALTTAETYQDIQAVIEMFNIYDSLEYPKNNCHYFTHNPASLLEEMHKEGITNLQGAIKLMQAIVKGGYKPITMSDLNVPSGDYENAVKFVEKLSQICKNGKFDSTGFGINFETFFGYTGWDPKIDFKVANERLDKLIELAKTNEQFNQISVSKIAEVMKSKDKNVIEKIKFILDKGIHKNIIDIESNIITEDNYSILTSLIHDIIITEAKDVTIILNQTDVLNLRMQIYEQLKRDPNFENKDIVNIIFAVRSQSIEFIEDLCFRSRFSKDQIANILEHCRISHEAFDRRLCFEEECPADIIQGILEYSHFDSTFTETLYDDPDIPNSYISKLLSSLRSNNRTFIKNLYQENTYPKSELANLALHTQNADENVIQFLEDLIAKPELPNKYLPDIADFTCKDKTNIEVVQSYLKSPEMLQWVCANLDNGCKLSDLDAISKTQEKLLAERTKNNKKAQSQKTPENKEAVKSENIISAEAEVAKPEDVIKAEEALVKAGVHPKATTGYIKMCQENGFVDKVKLDAICALAAVCDANEVKSLIKEIKNIFNLAVGSPLSNANGIFRPDIIKDIVAFKKAGIADFKLAANLSAAKNMSTVEFKSRLNSKTREDLAARVRNLEPEIKNQLKEQGYDIESLADKAVADPKIPSDAKLVNAAPQTVELRALDSIVGVERIVLNKFKAELDQNIWGDSERFKAWAEAKLDDLKDFNKHPEYIAHGSFAKFNNARIDGIQKWYNFMKQEGNADIFSQLLVMSEITKEMKPNNAVTPPAVSHGAFEETLNIMLAGNTNVSFSKIYAEQTVKKAIEKYGEPTQFVDGIEGRWVTIPQSTKDEPDYDEHIAMVQNLSRGSSWCLRFENAHNYLQQGRISFFLDKNGNAQVAINISSNGRIIDLEKRYNQDRTVPVPYCQVIEEFLNKQGVQDLKVQRETALAAKPAFDREKARFAELQANGDYLTILKELGFHVTVAADGTYILDYYSPKRNKYTLFDLGINENALLSNVSEIQSDLNLNGSAVTSMPKLRVVGGSINLGDNKINDIRNLEILNGKKITWIK